MGIKEQSFFLFKVGFTFFIVFLIIYTQQIGEQKQAKELEKKLIVNALCPNYYFQESINSFSCAEKINKNGIVWVAITCVLLDKNLEKDWNCTKALNT